MNQNKKHARYQDYVIRDGRLIGEFEEMYRDHDDPWHQSSREAFSSEKAVAVNLLRRVGARRVIEVGCGLGYFTRRLADAGLEVLGLDVAPTAIAKAVARHGAANCRFQVADVLDPRPYQDFRPDAVVMAEVTWYILDQIPAYLQLLRQHAGGGHLIHLLNTYPTGQQKYGADRFTDLDGIRRAFALEYLEWGEIHDADKAGCSRTYFCALIPE